MRGSRGGHPRSATRQLCARARTHLRRCACSRAIVSLRQRMRHQSAEKSFRSHLCGFTWNAGASRQGLSAASFAAGTWAYVALQEASKTEVMMLLLATQSSRNLRLVSQLPRHGERQASEPASSNCQDVYGRAEIQKPSTLNPKSKTPSTLGPKP